MVEKYAEKHHINQVVTEAKTRKTHKNTIPDIFVSLPKISEHLNALKTAQTRHIPLNIQEDMYYCESFFLWTKEHTDKFAEMPIKDHPRWIIPWYNRAGEVIGYQARAYGNEQPKYYTIILDKSSPKIYGLERIDFGKRVYCVEGPIDSLMLDNAVAVGSSALHTFSSDETEVTYVLDNENRNAAILKEYAKLIKLGYDVCIMPNEWKYKDLNDAVCAGYPREDLTKFIDRNTYNGLAAQMKLTSWRKTNYD
jgi:hypothetical protein